MYYKQERESNHVGIQAQPLLFIKIQLITLISKYIHTIWGFICITHNGHAIHNLYVGNQIYKSTTMLLIQTMISL